MSHQDKARKPRVHIIVVAGSDYEMRKTVSVPLEDNNFVKTFAAAYRTVPTMLSCDPKLIVVIHGTEVFQYAPTRFAWLCGAAPDPDGKDKNWMGNPNAK